MTHQKHLRTRFTSKAVDASEALTPRHAVRARLSGYPDGRANAAEVTDPDRVSRPKGGRIAGSLRGSAMTDSPASNARKVLVVDDSAAIRALTRAVLSVDERLVVVEANDGVEALSAVESDRPDLILLDINMPRMDGFQVLQTLRSNADTLDIPVIFFSADRPDELPPSQNAGFIAKPFDPSELLAKVLQTLAQV